MQPLTRFEIELVDHGGDRLGGAGTQRLLDRPQCFPAMRGLDQDQPGRIETQRGEAVAGQTAMLAVPIGRNCEKNFSPPLGGKRGKTGQNRRDEAQGGAPAGFTVWHDLMQRPAGKAAFRQMGIDRGKAEG